MKSPDFMCRLVRVTGTIALLAGVVPLVFWTRSKAPEITPASSDGLGNCGGATGGSTGSGFAGVLIAPQMLYVDDDGAGHLAYHDDPGGRITMQRMEAAKKMLDPGLANRSDLRKVSLQRLEQAIAARLKKGRIPTAEMRYLAGITRIQYVFFYPDSGDIVVAGPAEGWFEDLSGRVVGMLSNRPVLELQDLVVALRTYRPGGDQKEVIGCSIDPTKEGLAKMQQFLKAVGGTIAPNDEAAIVEGIRTSLGMQQVRILGVPPSSHFAQVLVEADYRMKLIGIGDSHHVIKIDSKSPRLKFELKSYAELADAATISRNALNRWWFVPDYKCLRLSADHLAMEMVGQGVKLVGEDEVVGADGQRASTGKTSGASTKFTQGFTKQYTKLSQVMPVYAQLRNLIDMAVVAAHIQRQDFYGKAGWTMPVFGEEDEFPVQTYHAPSQVETAVTSLWKGHRLVTPVGGGVHVEAQMALDSENLLHDEDGAVDEARKQTALDHLQPGQWWWD